MNIPGKEHKVGNSVITVYSPLTSMNPSEKLQWFHSERDKNNPVLNEIARAVENCYKKG